MAELKKCPFCGGEAKIDIAPSEDGYRVACKRILGCGAKFEWFDKENEAIEAWNNRATEAEIRAKAIDEFFDELQKYEADDWLKLKMSSIYEIAEQLKGE